MEFKKEDLIKSPLNYTGGKYKLLPQILPLMPDNINTFVDLFCGGCNVGVNIKANNIICNDTENHVVNLMHYFKNIESKLLIKRIEDLIEQYGLSNTSSNGYEFYNCNSSNGVGGYNKDKYIKLRDDYNKDTSNNLLFFIVVLFAFSNQIKFNNKGKFNTAVNKRDFNNNVKKNTIKFVDKLKKLNIQFTNKNFEELNINKLNKGDMIYCDPPYLITHATYNEQSGWNEDKEIALLNLLDQLHNKDIKFALSNVFENKGKKNEILINWCEDNKDKYKIHYLNHTYGNCNYHAKDKSTNGTVEVLITNY